MADRTGHLTHRDPEAGQPLGVQNDLVLPLEPADGRDLSEAGHRVQHRPDGKVLGLPKLRQIESAGRILEDVLKDPSDAGGLGPEDGCGVRG